MVSKNRTSPNGRQKVERTDRDSIRWVVGLLLLFIGLFVTAAVLSYYFCWDVDQSVVLSNNGDNQGADSSVANLCGPLGAWLAEQIVGRSFGFFGILLPIIVVLIGVRIIRQQFKLFNHALLSLLFIMIMGSLTLGFAFGVNWSVGSSSGLGGAYGVAVGDMLSNNIGVVGTIFVILICWILIGVFINRNFINTVNLAGNMMIDKSEDIVDVVKHKVTHQQTEEKRVVAPIVAEKEIVIPPKYSFPEPIDEPQSDPFLEPQSSPFAQRHGVGASVENMAIVDVPDKDLMSNDSEGLDNTDDSDNPFFEFSVDASERNAVENGVESTPPGRVVMGENGVVELDLSSGDLYDIDLSKVDLSDKEMSDKEILGEEVSDKEMLGEEVSDKDVSDDEVSDEKSIVEISKNIKKGSESDDFGAINIDGSSASESREEIVVVVEANEVEIIAEKDISDKVYDPLKDLMNYKKPSVSLLEEYLSDLGVDDDEITDNKNRIAETLKYFGIPIQGIKATVGPTVTLYEIVQAHGVKISKIQGLENDIAQSLKALGIRIIAPMPGRGTIGIEVPNRDKQIVSLSSAIRSIEFQESKAELPIVIGRTIQNKNYVFDLAKVPHLLVAGATGQGKSVGLNAIIASLIYKKHPSQLKFVLVDPKMVEFSLYSKMEKHFLAKMESEDDAIITDSKKAVHTLNALCIEMDNRLELCKNAGVRNIMEYNTKFVSRRLNPEKGHRYLPYIVVIIDEFADLIMTAREVEGPVMRLAQKARAIGIHLIVATQRPDVKVITGGIKANFPARIAFRVMQMIDSRTIIDQPGANQLIGRGDMLFLKDGSLTRIQCALIETHEVERIVDHVSSQQSYTSAYYLPDYTPESSEPQLGSDSGGATKYDKLFAEIARDAVSGGRVSTSSIQRNYEVGFNRAGRIMTQLERAGVVGRQEGAKPRDILFHDSPSLEAKLQELGLF